MKKLVQLKNKENVNLDPINITYEKRILNLEAKSLNTLIENKYSNSWWSSNKINSNFIVIDLRSDSESDNISLYLPASLLKKYSSSSPYFIKNNTGLIFQCYVSSDGIFHGLNRAEAGTNYVANIYEGI